MKNQSQRPNKNKLIIPMKYLAALIGLASILMIVAAMYISSNHTTPAYDNTADHESLTVEEQEQLAEITKSLNSIDEIIMTNREQLSEVSLTGTDTEKTLTAFAETLAKLEENLSTVEARLKNFSEISSNENSSIHTAITDIFNRQEKITGQISLTMATIIDILSDMDAEHDAKFSGTYKKLGDLQHTVNDIQKNTTAYYRDLMDIISLFEQENQTSSEELTVALTEISDTLKTQIIEQFDTLQLRDEQNYLSLIEQMDSLHTQIDQTETVIAGLLTLADNQAENQQTAIREALTDVVNSLAQINIDFNASHTNIKSLITNLSEAGTVQHEEILSALTGVENNMSAGAEQNLNQISTSLDTLQQQFVNATAAETMNHEETVSVIKDLTGNMTASADHNLTKITSFLQEMENEFTALVSELESSTSQNFSLQQGNEDSHHAEAITALINSEKNMTEIAGQNLESVEYFITAMQTDFTTLITKVQNDMTKNFDLVKEAENANQSAALSSLSEMENAITDHADQNLAQSLQSLQDVQDSFDALITALKSEVTQGFQDLSDIDSALADLENQITDNAADNLDEIEKALQSMQDKLSTLANNLQSSMTQGFSSLQGTAATYYSDTITAITAMESNLITIAGQNYSDISDSMETMQSQLSTTLDTVQNSVINGFNNTNTEMSDNLTQLTTNLTGHLNQLDEKITNQYDSLATTINNNNSGQQTNYENLFNEIKQDLETVFQSVSNGKKILTSALLTKGMDVGETATFAEIETAITQIPTEIKVDEMAGEIEYVRHHHVNSAGELTGTATTQAVSGGCYTTPAYHQHITSCFGTCNITYAQGCYNSWTEYGTTSVCQVREHHSSCGTADRVATIRHAEGGGNHRPTGFMAGSHQTLTCTEENTIVGWSLGCGMVHDQIIGVNIVFDNAGTADVTPETAGFSSAPSSFDNAGAVGVTGTSKKTAPAETTGPMETLPTEIAALSEAPTVSGNELIVPE